MELKSLKRIFNRIRLLARGAAPKKIFILGLSKTGTTAISYLIYNALKGPKELAFEPTTFGLRRGEGIQFHEQLCSKSKHVVSKCLTFPNFREGEWDKVLEISSLYDICLWIDRDPRDRLISDSFYKWYHGHLHNIPLNKRGIWEKWYQMSLERVRIKEGTPTKYAFVDICDKWWDQNGRDFLLNRERGIYENLSNNRHRLSGWVFIKYEDFVDGNTEELSQALALKLRRSVQVPSRLNRVVRTKTYGNWRHWFLDQDVAFFKPIYDQYLESAGYSPGDWKLEYPSKLDATIGSEYMERIHNANPAI